MFPGGGSMMGEAFRALVTVIVVKVVVMAVHGYFLCSFIYSFIHIEHLYSAP